MSETALKIFELRGYTWGLFLGLQTAVVFLAAGPIKWGLLLASNCAWLSSHKTTIEWVVRRVESALGEGSFSANLQ
ncbi:MAG: hypothetical protein COB04_08245 [Gammaproteobacteria bacterium]|nr:MAG: hypothetical protein COB04_08245 [Gammaproteobacteria bacterium]